MKKTLAILLVSISLLAQGAGVKQLGEVATFSFEPPTTRQNGEYLLFEEIGGYRLKCGNTLTLVPAEAGVLGEYQAPTEDVLDGEGGHSCAMATVDTDGLVSPWSDPVLVSWNLEQEFLIPKVPTQFGTDYSTDEDRILTQYSTDFSEYAAGVQPNDWTRRFAASFTWVVGDDPDATGGSLLRGVEADNSSRNALTWDALDNLEVSEVFMRVRFGASGDSVAMALLRGAGAAGNETAYRHGLRPLTGEIVLAQYDGGSFNELSGSPDAFSISPGVFYNVLVKVDGTAHKIKAWADGELEPVSWNLTGEDTTILESGWTGLFRYHKAPVDIDFFGVGVGSSSAPRP